MTRFGERPCTKLRFLRQLPTTTLMSVHSHHLIPFIFILMYRIAQFGRQLTNTSPIKPFEKISLKGRFVVVETLNAEKHARSLYENLMEIPDIFHFTCEDDLTTAEEFMQRCLKKERNSSQHWFVTSRISSPNDSIGMICFRNLDPNNRMLELGGLTMTKKASGTVFGIETIALLSTYILEELNYNKIIGKIINPAAVKFSQKAGFVVEGEFHDGLCYAGRTVDYVCMGLRAVDWVEQKARLRDWMDKTHFGADGRPKRLERVYERHL